MTRFKIQVETKQSWEVETEAETKEQALEIRDKIYEVVQQFIIDSEIGIQETINMTKTLDSDILQLTETFGGDDFSEDDVTDMDAEELPEAERASLCGVYTLSCTCPNCGTETEYSDEQPEYGEIMDAMRGDGFAVVTCPDCETKYKQTSYKEY